MLSVFLASLLAASTLASSLSTSTSTSNSLPLPLPLVIWHGLGDNYASEGLHSVGDLAKKINPGTYVYYIRLDDNADTDNRDTYIGNMTTQLQQVCEALATHEVLSKAPAINALGFSQGGQFFRGYVERCNKPPVRNLVTFGSQHNGIAKYQSCRDDDWVCKSWVGLLKGHTWSEYVQSHLVPAQYYRSINDTTGEPSAEYLEYSNFLADINNERETKNSTYAKNLASLGKFAMYLFKGDSIVIPKETGWFAEVNITSEEVTHLRDRRIYKEDWIGLKKLDEKGGLDFRTFEGDHMRMSDEELVEAFGTYFAPPTTGWEGVGEGAQEVVEL